MYFLVMVVYDALKSIIGHLVEWDIKRHKEKKKHRYPVKALILEGILRVEVDRNFDSSYSVVYKKADGYEDLFFKSWLDINDNLWVDYVNNDYFADGTACKLTKDLIHEN